MPFETNVTPFVGDDDLGDFMLDIWLPFARDDCNWVDNRAPALGTRPDIELWTHRGTTGAPVAPYIFFRTSDRHMHIFTGDGVNTGEEIYDQPGNPANEPRNTSFDIPASGGVGNGLRCLFLNSLVGPYDAYWLFSDTSGSYIHCVVKVSSRQYRHFHVGLLQQVDGGPDLDASSFYVTGHFWAGLDPEELNLFNGVADEEHHPYGDRHRIGWRGNFYQDGSFSSDVINTVPGCRFYMPNLSTHTYDWYHAANGNSLTGREGNATKSVGDVNTSVTLGHAQTNYYDTGLGTVLFACHRNFTANANVLVPIYVAANFDFQSATRHGVVARVPDVFRVNMRDYSPEQEITVGAETYRVFPVINSDSQNTLLGEGYSGYEGLAYRVETGAVT